MIATLSPSSRAGNDRTASGTGLVPASPVGFESDRIHRQWLGDGTVVLTFDRPQSPANILDAATLGDLRLHLQRLGQQPFLHGLVLASTKPEIYIAGADLNALVRATPEELGSLVSLGQEVFNTLADFPAPTVAALHGAALGGGLELALACDYRVASDAPCTRLGLPETALGIVPAWGGCTRLPRLVGLSRSLDLVLKGSPVTAARALQLGLVDAVVPREHLLAQARLCIASGKPAPRASAHWLLRPLATARAWWACRRVRASTFGNYPALPAAARLITRNLHLPRDAALAAERETVLALAQTDVAAHLLRLALLRERARKVAPAPPLRHALVVGAGVMGAGIAQWLAARGVWVQLRDVDTGRVAAGLGRAGSIFERSVRRGECTALEARDGMDRITPSTSETPLRGVDLVVEAVAESLAVKQEVLGRISRLAGPATILATNTSALSITAVADATVFPERVVGLHFFNPVHRMPLVEVARGRATNDATIARAAHWVRALGKVPVLVKDHPGFLVNRILMPYLLEAVWLCEQGASPEFVDRAMRQFGMPTGPLRLLDEVGVDVALHVADTLSAALGERLAVPEPLRRLAAAGDLGHKSGRGIYVHRGDTAVPSPHAFPRRAPRAAPALTVGAVQSRLALLMINEAARCVEEGVARDADDADLAMVLGAGFAPFRGGPLRLLDAWGARRVVEELGALAETHPRFAPCALLQHLSAIGATIHPK